MGYKLCSTESAIATCDSYNYKPKFRRNKNNLSKTHQHNQHKLRHFTYAELEAATNRFSQRNILGKGSHGTVYRAILDNGSYIVAVKRPTTSSSSAAANEIDILPRIPNRRIVNLIGYAGKETRVADQGKLLLVVEYMPNGSLYDLIHNKQQNPPSWSTRIRTALHVAKAVRTLHIFDPPIIHRDIKSTNVLLDDKLNARLSDFGLALSCHAEDARVMSTPPAGTLGYLDPCYLVPGDVSTKSDVFSFGILLLEIISGRRAIDVNYSPPAIIEWAIPLIKAGDYRAICDPRIGSITDRTVVKELGLLAARCVRSTAEKRPPMTEVVECLKMVYKRFKLVKKLPMLSNIRRRVERVGKCQPLDEIERDGSDWEEHVRGKSSKYGSRKSTRKVSNVTTSEERVSEILTRVEHRTSKVKSKSIGSFREINVGPCEGNCEIITVNDGSNNNNNNQVVMKLRPGQVRVKLSNVVRLSKSRSMSVLQSQRSIKMNEGVSVVKIPQVNELDELPLLLVKSSNSSSKSASPT